MDKTSDDYEYIKTTIMVPDENPNFPAGFFKRETRYVKVMKEKPYDFDSEEIII